MGQRMAGKVALISGGASGLGEAQAILYAREGAAVAIGDLQEDKGADVVARIAADGGRASFVRLDVTDLDNWHAAVAHTLDQFGAITTLVNNAGIFHPGGVASETPQGWDRMVAINQTGVFYGMKAAVRVMGKGAALEFARQGIRVNTIFPGQIRTPILGDITPEQDAAIKASIPMGVVGDPMDIAHGSLFLASDEARYVTGAELWIDGGWYAGC